MALRYAALVYSQINDMPYSIGIYDSTFVGTAQTVEVSGEGFSIEYERQGDERFAQIKGSKCNVFLKITDDAVGADLQSWITTNLLASKEDNFQIAILRDGSLMWVGNVLHDLSMREDASKPWDFTLTATDGLARLKDFKFTYATTNNDKYKMTDYIFEILKETPLYKLNISSFLYSTCVEWWEDSMPARAANKDPLDFTKVHCYTFTNFDEKKQERTEKTYYEVLEEICKAWGMRVMMTGGIFKFVQINNYEDDGTTKYARLYTRLNAYDSNSALASALTITNASPIRETLAGNQWNYFAPLKNVFLSFPFTNKNLLNGETNIPYTQSLPSNMVGGTGIRLVFSALLKLQVLNNYYVSPATPPSYRIVYAVRINLNSSKYLRRNTPSAPYTWENTSSYAYFDIVSDVYNSVQNLSLSFTTPEIPAGTYTTNSFSIEVIEVKEITTGNVLIANTDYFPSRLPATTSLVYNSQTNADNQTGYKYQARNTSVLINSYDLDLGTSLMGENFFTEYYGGLHVYNGTSYVPSTSQWRVYDTGTGVNFNYRRVVEVMSGQIVPNPKYQGALIGSDIYPDSRISYNSETYILNGGSYTAGSETWDGEWFKVSTTRASVYEIENAVSQSDGSTTDLFQTLGGLDTRFSVVNDLFIKGGQVQATYATTTDVYPFTQILMGDTDLTEFILPPAADWIYQERSCEITIINNCPSAADEVIITPNGTETINGAASLTLTRYQSVIIVSDGANLFLKSAYLPT